MISGWSTGTPPARLLLIFMQFWGKSGKFVCWHPPPLECWRPLLTESWIHPWWCQVVYWRNGCSIRIFSNYHLIIDLNFTGLLYDAWTEQTNRKKFMCAAMDKEHDLKWVERPCFHKSGYICQYGKDSQYHVMVKVKFVKRSTYFQTNQVLICSW